MPLATRPLSDFLPLVLPNAAGCPNLVALQYLRLAAIEWCERTRAWREMVTTTVAMQGETIVAPDYATIFEIERAEFTPDGGSQAYEVCPTQFTSHTFDDMDEARDAGPPRYITQASPNTVRLIPYMDGLLTMSLFLKPRSGTEYGSTPINPLHDTMNVVPEHLFIQSAEAIAEGALARLLFIRNAEWFDPKQGMSYRASFDKRCDVSFRSEIRGQQRAAIRSASYFI